MGRALTGFDKFMAGNLVLWSAVILFGYQWRHLEFYIYVLLVVLQAAGMVAAWALLRRIALPLWLLALLEVAILLHLAGGSIFIHGTRLYDCYLTGALPLPPWFSQLFRYDKLLHGYFAAVGLVGLRWLWPRIDLGGAAGRIMAPVLMLLVVMGVCSLVEIAEYIGTKVVSLPEVGGYDNNLQDLLANLCGALAAAAAPALKRLRVHRAPAVALLLTLALIGPLLVPPVGAAVMAYPPVRHRPDLPAPPYEEVTFPSSVDGLRLAGWYLTAPVAEDEGRTVIIVHGFLNDRTVHGRGLPLAEALRARGFNVLLFDLRGQGKSQHAPFTFGAREAWDVAGAVAYARLRGAAHIGLLGYSVGAIASILAAADDPGISAVVADSALTDLHQYLTAQIRLRSHLGERYADYALVWYRWFTHSDERWVAPAAAIGRLAPRPLLLIHGLADRVIPPAESEALLQAAANPRAALWLVPGGRHTHSYEADPAAYLARVTAFLDESVPAQTGGEASDRRADAGPAALRSGL